MAQGPITLNKAQFAATAAGQRPGASYGNYLSFIAARRGANKAAAPAAASSTLPGPLEPWTAAQIAAKTNQVNNQFGTPLTEAQIQTQAQGQISPIIAALTKAATDRATGASAAIKGLTDSYAAQLASENFAAPYQQAEQGQAAVDAALQQSLAGQGGALAADLQHRLGQINDPTVAAAASGLADRGAALGTTQLASGSSALSELLANAAAAGEYGLKQPVIARNAGIQGVAQANAQATNDIATGTQGALTQLPQIVQALEASNASLRANRASTAASLFGTLTGQNITKASLSAGLTGTIAKANATVTAAQTRAAATEAAAQTRAAASTASKAATAAKPSTSMTRLLNDGLLHDANGTVVLRNGQPVKVAIKKPTKNSGGYTLSQQAHYNGLASSLAAGAAKGSINPDTNKPFTYQEMIDEAVKSGVPAPFMVSQLSKLGIFDPTPKTQSGQSKPARPGTRMVENGVTYQWDGSSWNPVK